MGLGHVNEWWDYPEKQETISVISQEERPSLVLDQHGRPYYLQKQHKIGFDLRKRNNGESKISKNHS